MGNADDGLALIAGLTIVGGMAYFKWYRGKTIDFIANDVSTKLTTLLDSIMTQLPALPAPPTFTPPSFQPTNAMAQQPADLSTSGINTTPTNTVSGGDEPQVNEAAQKPAGSGQLATNPTISAPPASSGGAIVAFAGDWTMNGKAKQTSQVMQQQNVSFVIGTGDYSYGPAAQTWFDNILGPKYKGRMVGAQGNHDNNSYLSVFGMTKWLDAFKVAPNLAVVTIDTESTTSAADLDAATLKAKSFGVKHIAYAMHKPYITSTDGHHKGSENKSGNVIEAAVRKHGIKLVVSGHNHVYEHFFCNGTHYVTSGAAGRDFYKSGCVNACPKLKCINNTNGFLKVAVGSSLACQFITNTGSIQDTFTIT